jgi:hypothetical protein
MNGENAPLLNASKNRVLVRYRHSGCCGSGGLEASDNVPLQLRQKGLTQEEWVHFVGEFEQQVPSTEPGVLCTVLSWAFLVPLFCYCQQKTSFNAAVRKWLQEFNEVLVPKGMYAKFQTVMNRGGGDDENYNPEESVSWLVIATTHIECAKLKEEAVVWSHDCCDANVLKAERSFNQVYCCCGDDVVI